MNKKAQGISINTIIIAAIALAVLVVLFAIFTGRLGIFSKGVQETTNCRQSCNAAGYNPELTKTASESGSCDSDTFPLLGAYEVDNGVRMKCCCKR